MTIQRILSIAILIWIALALAALADPTINWGASTATLSPCHAADLCVTVINRLSVSPSLVSQVLVLDGIEVKVDGLMGIGPQPDWVHITPPPGWIAEPPSAEIAEDSLQVFRLFAPQVS